MRETSERVLKVGVADAIRLLEGTRWKYYEDLEDEKVIRIEFKKNDEPHVIELRGRTNAEREAIKIRLDDAGFIESQIRTRRQI